MTEGFRSKSVTFSHSARYLSSGLAIEQADHVLLCLHGYGQLAPYFLRKFKVLEKKCSLLFPEGLHKFYLTGDQGRVGASWMTKDDRERDISNYLRYIDSVVEDHLARSSVKLSVMGFSQGCATAGRWAAHTQRKVEHLVLWCGMFPPDVALDIEKLSTMRMHSVYGTSDPYLSDDRYITEKARFSNSSIDIIEIGFDGGHEIPADVLKEWADRNLI